MQTTTAKTLRNTEAFVEMLQQELEAAVENYTDGEVYPNGTEELVMFNGTGFEVTLSNGASFQIQVVQTAEPDEEEMDVEELLMLDPETSWNPEEAEQAQQELADAVEAYSIEGDHGPFAEGLAKDIEAIADTVRGYFDRRDPYYAG